LKKQQGGRRKGQRKEGESRREESGEREKKRRVGEERGKKKEINTEAKLLQVWARTIFECIRLAAGK
jgi:hypothetical protein